MRDVSMKHSPRFNRLAWFITPVLLLAICAVGGFSLFRANAASPLDGRYDFRGITTSGSQLGLYITGDMILSVDGSGNVTGNICGLSLDHSHCTEVKGTTPDNVHVSLTFRHVGGYPDISLSGAFQASAGKHGGFDGFAGTYTFGSGVHISSGSWDARVGTAPALTGTWSFYGHVLKGPHAGQQLHGVLTLLQRPDGSIVGSYTPDHGGTPVSVSGGFAHDGNFNFYIDFGSALRLRGTFFGGGHGANRIGGQFESLDTNSPLADRGIWLGH